MDTSTPQRGYEHHELYYLKGTYVTFLVEDKLFRVPQYQLVLESEVLRGMFSLPRGDAGIEGSSDEAPIRLPPENVRIADFMALLKVLYPIGIPNTEPSGIGEWESILHLASFWEMDSVRKLATTKLDTLLSADAHAVKNTLLGKRFENHHWLLRGYEALVRRQESPTNEEAAEIGWFSAIGIFRLREKYPPKASISESTRNCVNCGTRDVKPQQYSYRCGNCSCGWTVQISTPSTSPLPPDAVSKAFMDEFKVYKSYTSSLP